MAQATFSCREAAIHLAGRRSAERKKHAGGMLFSPRKSPISSTIHEESELICLYPNY